MAEFAGKKGGGKKGGAVAEVNIFVYNKFFLNI